MRVRIRVRKNLKSPQSPSSSPSPSPHPWFESFDFQDSKLVTCKKTPRLTYYCTTINKFFVDFKASNNMSKLGHFSTSLILLSPPLGGTSTVTAAKHQNKSSPCVVDILQFIFGLKWVFYRMIMA